MLGKDLLKELKNYVEWNLSQPDISYCKSFSCEDELVCHNFAPGELEDFIKENQQPTFNQLLFGFIDKKELSDPDIYKKAGIDRKHFSKIRTKSDYHPRKNTVVALALALELNKKETYKLLSAAGYSLSDSDTFDLVIQFCLEKKIYDIDDVNQALDYFSLKPLGGVLE